MNQISDNNFNFIEKKNKTRVHVGSTGEETHDFFGDINGNINKSLSGLNDGIGELDNKIVNALKSLGDTGKVSFDSDTNKKGNSVVDKLSEDLQVKLNKINIIDSTFMNKLYEFLSLLGKDTDLDSLASLDDILSKFKEYMKADGSVSEDFINFLRALKKLLDSLRVKDDKVILDLSDILELLNKEDSELNNLIQGFLKSLVFGDGNNLLSDDILNFFSKLRKMSFLDDKSMNLLSRILYKRLLADYKPVDISKFLRGGITDSNVPQLLKDINIEQIFIDGKNAKEYLDPILAKNFIYNLDRTNVSMPIWADSLWQSSNEKRLKELYKFSRSKEMGTNSEQDKWEDKNDYVKNLLSLLTPTVSEGKDGMNSGVNPDEFAKLIVQNYFIRDPNNTKIRSNVQLKNGVVIPKEIKLTEFDTKDYVNKSFFQIDENELVKIFTSTSPNAPLLSTNINGHILLPHIQMSTEDNITKIGDVIERQEAASNMAMQHAIHNSAIKCLLRRMPDFKPNMYYGVISQYDETDEKITDILNITGKMPFEQQLGEQLEQILKTYFVRLQGVPINGMSTSPVSWKFMGRNIPKIPSNFSETHKTDLTFSLDQNGLILNKFNALAAIFGSNFDDTLRLSDNVENNFYSQTFFPSTFFNNKSRIDITIMYNDFNTIDTEGHFSSYGATQKMIMNDEQKVMNLKQNKVLGYQRSYRAFVFEDVRFLGSNTSLNFERDSGGHINNVSIPILYKRISTIDNNF